MPPELRIESWTFNVERLPQSSASAVLPIPIKRHLAIAFAILLLSGTLRAQTPSPPESATPAPEEETIVPTFETQKLARTYILDVPAPRGLITDRNGLPLAQNKLNYSLG